MMSDHLRWISPLDPRGMTTLGTLGVIILSVGLWSVQGTLSEVWPNRCSLFKAQLTHEVSSPLSLSDPSGSSSGPSLASEPLTVTATLAADAERLDLWSVARTDGGVPWLIPKRDYVEARVSAQPLAPVWVELITRGGERVVLHLRADQRPIEVYQHLIGAAQVSWVSTPRAQEESTRSESAREIEVVHSSELWESALRRRALSLTPQEISCEPSVAHREVLDVLALTLKRTEHGLKSAWLIHDQVYMTEHQLGPQTQRRLYRSVSRPAEPTGESSRWLWTWTWDQPKRPLGAVKGAPPRWLTHLLNDLEPLVQSEEREALIHEASPRVINESLNFRSRHLVRPARSNTLEE